VFLIEVKANVSSSRLFAPWGVALNEIGGAEAPPIASQSFKKRDQVPPELLTRLAVSTFTPGPIVDEIATRLM